MRLPDLSQLPDLPVRAVLGAVTDALAEHGSAVLVAPPGTGKTTLVPLALAAAVDPDRGRVLVAEPRRLATRAAAARMAVLHARGQMAVGDTLVHSSIIESEFVGTIRSTTTVGGVAAIVPTVRGRAWITGFHNYVVDPTDPYPEGYLLSDTWGVSGLDTQT